MLKTLTRIKPRDVPLIVALRNSAAVVLPLAAGIISGHVSIGLGIASGALNTMFLDQPGPYRLRMQRMLLTALGAAVSGCVGSLVGANSLLMVIVSLIWGVGGGILVALGPNAGRAGLACMILLLVMSAVPRTAADAFSTGLLIFAGGALQTLFALAAWPLLRYRPERDALARVCHELAAITHRPIAPDRLDRAPPVTQGLLDIEQLLHGAHRARGTAMESFRVLARVIERMRLELLALGDVISSLSDDGTQGEARHTLLRLREYTSRTLAAIGDALQRGASPLAASAAIEGYDAALAALEELGHHCDASLQRQLTIALARAQALGGQLRAMVRNADFAGSRGELRAEENEARLPLRTASATAPWPRYARISICSRSHSGMRCAAACASRSPSPANVLMAMHLVASGMASGCR